MRRRRGLVATVAAAGPLLLGPVILTGPASGAASAATPAPEPVGALSAAQAALLSSDVTQPVVVILKDQHPDAPATPSDVGHRSQLEAADQAPIVSEMGQTRSADVRTYRTINAVAATVSPGEEQRLAADPAVAQVIPDSTIPLASPTAAATAAAAAAGATPAAASSTPGSSTAGSSACAPAGQTQLDPQALEQTATDSDVPGAKTARSLGFTGAGVKVAFMADGVDITNPDFVRPDGTPVFVDYKDFSGDGANAPTGGGEAFLDASSIAAQGRQTYDISSYSPLSLGPPCNIRVEGMAPGASLVGLKVFAQKNATLTSDFLQAIDYAVSVDHVDVLSESFGSNYFSDTAQDAVRQFDEDAVAAGTTVVVSSGDAGVTSTIGSPSSDPAVISAGATTSYRLDEQTGYGGARWSNGTYLDGNISSFSSGGFTQANRTVDLVAPGELNWALCSTDTAIYSECTNYAGKPSPVQATGGTSESAPLTAGAAALVIQAFRSSHQGQSPTPAIVKQILTSTADDANAPGDQQGGGMLDSYRAVQAALSYQLPAATGSQLLEGINQLNVTGAPGTSQQVQDTVTNDGAGAQTVNLAARTLGAYQPVASSTVTLADTDPHTTDWQGVKDNVATVTFTVPPGASRLSASTTQPNANPADAALHERVRMTLIDPSGALASYDVPQGDGNYDNAQVTNPKPGTWTAYVYSRDSKHGGYTGPVTFGAGVASYGPFGSVSPSSVRLAPGQTTTVTLTTPLATAPGDQAASLVVAGAGGTTTVPVTVRSLIPLSSSAPTTFTGTLTGGNGRGPTYAQQFTYQMDVRSAPELNVNVVAASPADRIATSLVGPTGQIEASSTNQVPTTSVTGSSATVTPAPIAGQQDHVLAPEDGRWTLLVALYLPSGTALAQPYQVSVDEQPVAASATVPAKVPAGKTTTTTVQVTNHGSSPEEYFVDARLDRSTTLPLSPLGASPQLTLPLTPTSTIPQFAVPPDTSAIAAAAQGSVPLTFDYSDDDGFSDPDLPSLNASTTAYGVDTTAPVQQGLWAVYPQEVGPYPASGAPSATAGVAMVALTQAFDPGVTASTGDLWLSATDPNATLTPVVVQPGQIASIPVAISPTRAQRGTTVTGTLYVDDLQLYSAASGTVTATGPLATPNGNQLAAIPYTYRVR